MLLNELIQKYGNIHKILIEGDLNEDLNNASGSKRNNYLREFINVCSNLSIIRAHVLMFLQLNDTSLIFCISVIFCVVGGLDRLYIYQPREAKTM
jgi:hypothetical protein